MRALYGFLAGFGAVGIAIYIAVCFAFAGFMIYAAVYGLYLAFSASVLLGIICFFVQPSPSLIGLVMIFFHKNLAQMIMEFLNK